MAWTAWTGWRIWVTPAHGQYSWSRTDSAGNVQRSIGTTARSFSESSGAGPIPLLIPPLIAASVALLIWRRRPGLATSIAALLPAFAFVTGFSIGGAYWTPSYVLVGAGLLALLAARLEAGRAPARSIASSAALYFGVVFACGFVLGALRTLVVAPRLGARTAELSELLVVVLVSWACAGWVVRRYGLAERPPMVASLVGLVALVLMVAAELLLVLPVRHLTLVEYWRGRDPVSSAGYLVSLLLFAVFPWLRSRSQRA